MEAMLHFIQGLLGVSLDPLLPLCASYPHSHSCSAISRCRRLPILREQLGCAPEKAGPPVYPSGCAWGESAAGNTSERGLSWPRVLKPASPPGPRAPPLCRGEGRGRWGRKAGVGGGQDRPPSARWGVHAPRAARLLPTPEAKCCPLELKAELKKNKSLKNETFRLNGRYFSKSCSLNSEIDACRTFLFFRVMFCSPNTSDSVPQASDEARYCGGARSRQELRPLSTGSDGKRQSLGQLCARCSWSPGLIQTGCQLIIVAN